jgi:hypothetical protein
MNRFAGMSKDEARTFYRQLARENHPDMGGDLRTMQAINAEYAEYCADEALHEARTRQTEAHSQGKKSAADYHDMNEVCAELRAKLEELLNISPDLIVEVCGMWIWVTGATRAHYQTIKVIEGMRYAYEKQAWYYAAIPSFNRHPRTLDEIRQMHGSQVFSRQQAEHEPDEDPFHFGLPAGG